MEDPANKGNAPRNFTLHDAVKCGKEELVVSLINDGADVNARDDDGNSVLFYAVKEANLRMVELLLNHKADITSPIILNTAVKTKNFELFEYLLDHGADINASDQLGRTVLHEALRTDNWINEYFADQDHRFKKFFEFTGKVTRLLLQRGAQVNAKTNEGSTPLHGAAMMGCNEAIQVLLDFHADVHARNAQGETALEVALPNNNNPETMEILVKYGDCVNSKDKNGKFIFHMEAKRGHDYALEIFLKCGVNINGKDDCGKTALHYAVEADNLDSVLCLLGHGVSINCRDAFQETPLHIASYIGHGYSVQCLLEYGADVNAQCSKGETALVKAIEGSCMKADDDFDFFDDVFISLKQYIIMRDALNLFVRPDDLIRVGDYDTKNGFRERCQAEIDKSRTEMVSNFSYYDVLTSNVTKLAKYATSYGGGCAFQFETLKEKFPIYADMLFSQFETGRVRACLMKKYYDDVIIRFMGYCFSKLPRLCTDIILTYLDNDDLKILIEAWEPALADPLKLIHFKLPN